MTRNMRRWIIAAVAAAVLVVLLVLWSMRPSRQGQPGEPGRTANDVKASSAEVFSGWGPVWSTATQISIGAHD